MRKILLAMAAIMLSGAAMAEAPTYIEGALIFGGENARNSGGKQSGIEAAGSWGFTNN